MIFSIRKQYLNYLSQARKKQFEIPKYLELLVDKAIDLFNLSGISCVDMLQYMLEHDINNWVHYYAYTFIIPIAQGKSSECVKDLSDLYALVMTGYILDDFGFNRLNIEEIVKGEQLTHKKNQYGLSVVNGVVFHNDYFVFENKAYLYNILTNIIPVSFGDVMPGFARVISEQREVGNILLRLDDRLALPEEQAISYSTLNFEKYRGPQFHFKDTLLKTSKTISVHFNGKTMDKLLMVVKQKFDEKENKSFWHIELETLPYRNRESKGKYCITTFLHGMYYPDEDIFTHIDYTKNQYDIDTYLNKYSDCNEDMPIDTYTSSNELHYKIWCIEGGKYSRETWYRLMVVDDMPYVIGLGMDVVLNLHEEYKAIMDMFEADNVTYPIKAFFGELLERPRRTKAYPIALINKNINLDQLLAINNAMKYPLAYIQGPPGTGKTNTIINTIVTAFFNNVTVLFASYNNVPIDNVFEKLSSMKYRGKTIPFPVLRLGNTEKVMEAIKYINELRTQVQSLQIFASTLDKRKDDRIDRAKRLSARLKEYEEILDLKERKETLTHLMKYQEHMKNTMKLLPFQTDLQGYQMQKLDKRIAAIGEISDADAMQLLDRNEDEFYQYLFYTSARYIKALEEPKFQELRQILDSDETPEKLVNEFNKYMRKSENVRKLQRVFPIIITTCISAHKIGEPEPLFDMTIMDEASQCNVAISLVPIIRGEKLMLVGDPQQLNPVILLGELTNKKLRRRYHVSDEYDYRENSIYKTYLACDAVSDEVLLRNHYRCNKEIIGFNNKKYYNSKLKIQSKSKEPEPLVYMDVKSDNTQIKNTSPAEVEEVVEYALLNKDKSIAVITPFVNQKQLIENAIKQNKLSNLVCGTVHAFQGDEKDVVLFSTAISERTSSGTYNWLKNNKELINVATSRAKEKLVLLTNGKELERLHAGQADDDLYELAQYIKTNGHSKITEKHISSRALGIQPFSTATENAFLENLTHALENIWLSQSKYVIHKEVAISQVFRDNITYDDLFYMGRFDFVVYEKQGRSELPILAIELDGKEHFEDAVVKERDRKKNAICKAHNMEIIRVENSYARRYNHIKGILMDYFSRVH